MGNRKELVSSLQELREDNIRKQKRGLTNELQHSPIIIR